MRIFSFLALWMTSLSAVMSGSLGICDWVVQLMEVMSTPQSIAQETAL